MKPNAAYVIAFAFLCCQLHFKAMTTSSSNHLDRVLQAMLPLRFGQRPPSAWGLEGAT